MKAVRTFVHSLTHRHAVTYTDLHDAKLIFCWPRKLVSGKLRMYFQEPGKPPYEVDGDDWYERMHKE